MSNRQRTTPARHNDPDTWYTRSEVGAILAVTSETVRLLEKNGVFTSFLDSRGLHRIDPDELDRYQRTLLHKKTRANPLASPRGVGDIAAEAFKLFELGATKREVVMRLAITPQRAMKLWTHWREGFEETAERQRNDADAAERRARLSRIHKMLSGAIGAAGAAKGSTGQ